MTIFCCRYLHISKKSSTFVADLKPFRVMTDKTISSYQGFGHRVQLIRRAAVAREFAVCDNRRVLFSTTNETHAKDLFLNHVAGIVRQLSMEL